jgi:hypothetical protein
VSLFACELRFPERFQMAWQLTWPTLVVDTTWALLVHGAMGVESQGAMLAHEFLSLLVVAPWLVRRMVGLRYPAFRLKTLFADGEGKMSYTESFKVMWLLSWRTTALAMFLLLPVVAAAVKLTGINLTSLVPSGGSEIVNQIGLSLVMNSASLVLLPLVIPGMFAKRYQGFRVVPERLSAAVAAAPSSSAKRK